MSSTKKNVLKLSLVNAHVRDGHIAFKERGHVYNVDGDTSFISVTKFVHKYPAPFNADVVIDRMLASGKNKTYDGMTKNEIKLLWKTNSVEAMRMGTKMHYAIECYYNYYVARTRAKTRTRTRAEAEAEAEDAFYPTSLWDGLALEKTQFDTFKEWQYAEGLQPYRTEWAVYHEDKRITGSIDMVFKNKDGGYDIYDWKRTKEIKQQGFNNFHDETLSHLPDCNFWTYSLQLNMYKMILEEKYDMRVDNLYLIAIYPGQESFIKYKVPNMGNEVADMVSSRH